MSTSYKAWLLRPRYAGPTSKWGGRAGLEKGFGFVVRAKTEKEARRIASVGAGEEGESAWLLNRYSSCQDLASEIGEIGILLSDVRSA